jgi:arylsulfatase I/J
MMAFMDDIVGNITQELKTKEMWNKTLLIWSSDNGGAVHLYGGANVYPLRGGYMNNWEGGIR